MPSDLPHACSLSAAAAPLRLAEMAALGRDSLIGVTSSDAEAALRFRADAATRERLAAIVAAESECCAFLTMSVHDAADASTLTIQAPDGGELVMQELVAAFAAGTAH